MDDMRYPSLLSVDFVLIDARKDLDRLRHVLLPSLIALQNHFQYHIVFLCNSIRDAERIDLLGEQVGQELLFHGELIQTEAELDQLLAHTKALFIPDILWWETSRLCKENNIVAPTIHFFIDRAKFYPKGINSDESVEATLLDCFAILNGGKDDAVIH